MWTQKKAFRSYSSPFILAICSLIIAALSIFTYVVLVKLNKDTRKEYVDNASNMVQESKNDIAVIQRYNNEVFNNINLIAQSYIVYDPLTGQQITSKNQQTSYPLASVTKVMTAYVAHKNIAIDENIIIQEDDLSPSGDSGLRAGDIWKRDDLIAYTLSVSSNDGARALARTAGKSLSGIAADTDIQVKSFIVEMNNVATQMGLASLLFYNESGLDIDTQTNGGYGNALDVAKLFAKVHINTPEVFQNTVTNISYISSGERINKTKNTNTIASSIPGLAASKTGFTDLALGNLGVVVEMGPGSPVVIVVLHSTKDGRFSDVEILRKAVLSALVK